jgi:hypothetical protein
MGMATFLFDVAETDKSENLGFKELTYLMSLIYEAKEKMDDVTLFRKGVPEKDDWSQLSRKTKIQKFSLTREEFRVHYAK